MSITGQGQKENKINPGIGSVLGKALENFNGTEGKILVMVNLQ